MGCTLMKRAMVINLLGTMMLMRFFYIEKAYPLVLSRALPPDQRAVFSYGDCNLFLYSFKKDLIFFMASLCL